MTFFDHIKIIEFDIIEVAIESFSSYFVRVVALTVALLTTIFFGRTFDAGGLGVVILLYCILCVLLILTMFGMQIVIIKLVISDNEKGNLKMIKNRIYTSVFLNGFFAIIVTALITLLSTNISEKILQTPQLKIPLIIISTGLVAQLIIQIFASIINGLFKNSLCIQEKKGIKIIKHLNYQGLRYFKSAEKKEIKSTGNLEVSRVQIIGIRNLSKTS